MKGRIIATLLGLLCVGSTTYAADIGIGLHAGYGAFYYKEDTSSMGAEIEAGSTQPAILVGLSGEYTPKARRNLFINLTTDWLWGLGGKERWREEGVEVQENDIRVFGQFYDLRFGYKDTLDSLYYRVYISGGWDGLNFRRDEFVLNGILLDGEVEEDFSLIRMGAGIGAGYKIHRWAVDGRVAYSYYPYAMIENTALPEFEFRTHGTCLDGGIGIMYRIGGRLDLYTGFSYTLLRLDESDVIERDAILAVFPESRTEIKAWMLNLTYAF
jgi:hypothetical protein